jgi:aldehyde:ferredoxin oxidoreductase
MGRILLVDLTEGSVQEAPGDPAVWSAYLGGRGFGTRWMHDACGPRVKALDPENSLVFATGPLTGTKAPASSRYSVSFKSPLTGILCDANAGGKWGVLLKRCGYDALVVTGRSKQPVSLHVTENGAALRDARALWGLDTEATTTELLAEGEGRAGVLCIGPAGENRVLISCIINERAHALGRGGGGAVMGSKNLKAIVVWGNRKVPVADPERMKFVTYEANKLVKAHPITSKGLPELGTAMVVHVINNAGIYPVRNFQASVFEGADRISGETITRTLFRKRAGCLGCIIQCKRKSRTAHAEGEGPEYETTWALGATLGIDDLTTVAEGGYLCNRLGLDIISTGGTIACAMELGERGVIDPGIRFGQHEKLLGVIESIAHRRGVGDALAEGAKRFASRHGAGEYAMEVKGLELPGYDPRGAQGQGLGYATSNRGGCHLRGGFLIGTEVLGVPRMIDRFSAVGKAGYTVQLQNSGAVADSLVVCRFATFALSEIVLARLCSAVTGEAFEAEDLLAIGERIHTLERMINLREGITVADDGLPRRLLEEPVKEGPSKGRVVDLEALRDEYYRFRGWTEAGVPTRAKLEALGLEFADHDR